MFVAWKSSDDSSVVQFAPSRNPIARVTRTIRRRRIGRDTRPAVAAASGGHSMFTHDRSQFAAEPWAQCPPADIWQLHWVAGFVDYAAFFESVPCKTRVVWTLHDMNTFTGGCHYDGGCGKFARECGSCPALVSRIDDDLSRHILGRKRAAFDAVEPARLHFVTPSRWLAECAGRSPLLKGFSCTVIPNGLDTTVFQPRDPHHARERLGIPQGAKVILFLADGANDPRKGYEFLVRALQGAAFSGEVVLLTLGRGNPNEFRGFRHVQMDAVTDDQLLSFVYSAADVFVAPSLQDNLPNTVLESTACGTPVVAFNTGGIPEGVRHGKTGLLVGLRDVSGLLEALRGILANNTIRAEMSRNCRAVALAEFSTEIQARRYLALYREITSASARVSAKSKTVAAIGESQPTEKEAAETSRA
jgi:glycosyltransferase involved in cell wall biosynthesis